MREANIKLEKKLYNFFMQLMENKYYKDIIQIEDISKFGIWDYYDNLPLLSRDNVLSSLPIYFLDNLKRKTGKEISLNELLTFDSISHNHDKEILINKQRWKVEFTTGSTGKPFPVIKSPKTRMVESLYLLKKRKEIYEDTKLNNGFLFLHPVDKDISSLNLWEFNENEMEYVIDKWKINPPKWIFATPLIFYKYANYIIKKSYENLIDKKYLKFIEYTSQPMDNEKAAIISKVFNTVMINNYGSREFWNIAYECRNGNLHINDDYLIINIVDGSGNIIHEYDIVGDIIITNLVNTDMPLLKYKIGDRGKFIRGFCSCGCQSPIIELVNDREIEKLKNTNYMGTKIFRRVMRGIYFHDLINDINRIKIIQDEAYHISVYLDKNKKYDKDFEEKFINRTKSIVPEFYKFKVSYIYEYPFANEDYRYKDIIFKSIICNS